MDYHRRTGDRCCRLNRAWLDFHRRPTPGRILQFDQLVGRRRRAIPTEPVNRKFWMGAEDFWFGSRVEPNVFGNHVWLGSAISSRRSAGFNQRPLDSNTRFLEGFRLVPAAAMLNICAIIGGP